MKTRQLGFTVAGIVALVIAFLVGRRLPVAKPSSTDRLVTISLAPNSNTECEVDYPVASVREKLNKIEWQSNDQPYWVSFDPLGETPQNYTIKSPLGSQNVVPVPANSSGKTSGKFKVYYDQNHAGVNCPNCPDYYMYAIYDHQPQTNDPNPCKKASVEHDTGVIVKR